MNTPSQTPSNEQHPLRPLLPLAALTVAALASAAVLGVDTPSAGRNVAAPTCAGVAAASTLELNRAAVPQVRTIAAKTSTAGSYGWPVRPFNRQHPVRAYFDDPRIGRTARLFHFGIDIAASDGAAVYAVEPGRVWVHGESVAVVSAGRVFGYWHIVPAVATSQYVGRHQLLGHIGKGWGHVHFAESINRQYRNPLRPGALAPYRDTTAPTIVAAGADGRSQVVRGRVTLVANAFDTTAPRVPGAWRDEPVTPALVSWRLLTGDSASRRWRTAADFRSTFMPAVAFSRIYAASTTQNHMGEPGLYCFNLARGFDTRSLPDGTYRLQVAIQDSRANRSVASVQLTIANDE
jgi:hypothetical protein